MQGVTLHFTLRRKNATARLFKYSERCNGAEKLEAHIGFPSEEAFSVGSNSPKG
jgi:hypothetical protein